MCHNDPWTWLMSQKLNCYIWFKQGNLPCLLWLGWVLNTWLGARLNWIPFSSSVSFPAAPCLTSESPRCHNLDGLCAQMMIWHHCLSVLQQEYDTDLSVCKTLQNVKAPSMREVYRNHRAVFSYFCRTCILTFVGLNVVQLCTVLWDCQFLIWEHCYMIKSDLLKYFAYSH